MHRDTKEALERLEAELLEESQQEEVLPDAETLSEDQLDSLLEDTQKIPSPEDISIYKNYSNGYKVYNSDKADRDPEELSEELLQPGRDPVVTGLTILAFCLLAAILGVLAWVFLTFRGII